MESTQNKTRCPHSKKCGGCQYQGMAYKKQLSLKQRQANMLLGKFGPVLPIIGMKDPYHYRNKVQAAFGVNRQGQIISGVYQSASHRSNADVSFGVTPYDASHSGTVGMGSSGSVSVSLRNRAVARPCPTPLRKNTGSRSPVKNGSRSAWRQAPFPWRPCAIGLRSPWLFRPIRAQGRRRCPHASPIRRSRGSRASPSRRHSP